MSGPVTFGPEDSGRNGHHVRYVAAAGETPVLNGATRVTGWTPHAGNIYKATLNRSRKLRNLYVNDTRAQMASRTAVCGRDGTHSSQRGRRLAWRSAAVGWRSTGSTSAHPKNKDDEEIVNARLN